MGAGILVFAALSDWLDGKLARILDQTSRSARSSTRGGSPLHLRHTHRPGRPRHRPGVARGLLVARELYMGLPLYVLRRHGYGPPPVHFIGKAATLCLLYAFPLLLLGAHSGPGPPSRRSSAGRSPSGNRALLVGGGPLHRPGPATRTGRATAPVN